MTSHRETFVGSTAWVCTEVHPSQQDHVVSLPDVNSLLASKIATIAVQHNMGLSALDNKLHYCLYNQHSGPFAFGAAVIS
jgi:hypothetical protein